MQGEIFVPSELTAGSLNPRLNGEGNKMPDNTSSETTRGAGTSVLERPPQEVARSIRFARDSTREAARRARETGERPPPIGGGAPRQASSRDIKEEIIRVALTIKPDDYTHPQIKNLANSIKTGDKITSTKLQVFKDVAKAVLSTDPSLSPEEAMTFIQFVDDLMHVVDVGEGRAIRQLPQEIEAKYYVEEFLPKAEKRKVELDRKLADGTITPQEEIERRELEQVINNFPAEQEDRLVKLVAKLPLQEGSLERSTIELIVGWETDRPLKYLINRLVSLPLDYELGRYNLGFYGGNNLESLKTYLQVRATSSELTAEKRERAKRNYETLLVVANSIEFFHGMNSLIVQGNLEGFIRAAENITPDQLQMMQGVFGASFVMRLLDQEYELLLSRDGWINNENYGKMMGFIIKDFVNPETGRAEGRIVDTYEGSVFSKFKEMVADAKITKQRVQAKIEQARARGDIHMAEHIEREYDFALKNELADMEEWEISWAFNVGKILHNLSLRPAEYISQGKNPEGAEQFASFPQENMARLMNWMNEMMKRFLVAEARGGVKLSDFVIKNYQKIKETDGYNKNKLLQIMGLPLDYFELAAVFETSGPFSSWRQTLMFLRQMPFGRNRLPNNLEVEMQTGEKLTLGHLIDTKLIKFGKTKFGDASDKQKADYFRALFLNPDHTLRNDINTALGILLKNSALAPSDDPDARGQNPKLEQAKRDIRRAIWERVAQDNPLAILPYLNGMEFAKDKGLKDLGKRLGTDKKDKQIRKIEIFGKKGDRNTVKFKDRDGRTEISIDYEKFHKTLSRIHEFRMRRIWNMGAEAGYLKLYDPNPNNPSFIKKLKDDRYLSDADWGDNENKFLEYISLVGETAAEDLAEVRFNFNPFMNDANFEKMRYGKAGAEFYRRRVAGDLGSLSKADNGYIAIANNPAGLSIEDFGKHIMEIVDGIGAPLGTDTGQRKAVPIEEAWIELGSRGSNDWDKIGVDFLFIHMLDLKKKRTVYFTDKKFSFEKVHKIINMPLVKAIRGYGPIDWALRRANKFNSWAQYYSGDAKGHGWSVSQKGEIIHHLAEIGAASHRWALYLRKRFQGKGMWKLWLYLIANIFPIPLIAGGVDLGKRPFTAGDEFKS